MNGKQHAAIGAVTGPVCVAGHRLITGGRIRPFEMVGAGIGGYLGGKVPDLLEPANSPNHRAFFHSVPFAGGLSGGAAELLPRISDWFDVQARVMAEKRDAAADWLSQLLYLFAEWFVDFCNGVVKGAVGGVLSHILADATTPASIPLIP